jgi:hypothetical protein
VSCFNHLITDDNMSLTPHMKRILDVAQTVQENPNNPDVGFMAWALVQATLPHSDPGDVKVWKRNNGKLTLAIQPHWRYGVPYGTIPRLLLFWLITEAVQTQKRRIELGSSLSSFMRELDIIPTGLNIKRFREQMRRLFRARISFDIEREYNGQTRRAYLDMDIAPVGEEWEKVLFGEDWWDYKQPAQKTLWPSWIELGEKFFAAINNTPIPVDLRILKAIKNSSLALDLYTWLNYRSYIAYKKNLDQCIPWSALEAQFGADYSRLRDFRHKAKKKLTVIQAIEPRFKVDFVGENLLIRTPKTPIITNIS